MKGAAKPVNNKLSRLGLLGFIGVLGLGSGIPYLAVFMVFLLFLPFAKVAPDEMFTQHVHKAGLRAFYVYLTATVAMMLLVFSRALYLRNGSLELADLRVAIAGQMNMMGVAFGWIFVITVCVFAFILMYYVYGERKALGQHMFKGLREFINESPLWGVLMIDFMAGIVETASLVIAGSFVGQNVMGSNLYTVIVYLLCAGALLIFATELLGFSRLGFKRQGLWQGLLWGLPLILAVNSVASWPFNTPFNASLPEIAPLLESMFIYLLVAIAVTFYSEILYRGLILNTLMEHWGHNRAGIYRALLVCACVITVFRGFVLACVAPPLVAFGTVVVLFCLSMFLGALYLYSGNLWVTAITYCCASFFTKLVSFSTQEGFSYTIAAAPMEASLIWKQVLCALPLLLVSLLLARAIKPRPKLAAQEENILARPEVDAYAENQA
jgi:membrane protease YdiL (CAAX protease family)